MKYILHVKLTVYYTVIVLHVTYIFWIQHILFSINLKITTFHVSFAVGYIIVHVIINDMESR